jgi:uncharacterized protein (TIGR02996 family)
MSTEEAFLQDILAHPEDDTPRLIFADWLADHGDPERGELIRLQCERAAGEVESGLPGYWLENRQPRAGPSWFGFLHGIRVALRGRPRKRIPKQQAQCDVQLLQAHTARWLRGLSIPLQFSRGFPEIVEISTHDYLRNADLLEQISPVQSVRLTSFNPPGADGEGIYDDEAEQELTTRLANHPALARWLELELVGCPGSDNFEALLGSPHLTRLRRLVATDNEVGPGVGLVADERFSHLRWLDLYNSDSASGRPGNRGLIPIVTSPHLANLEYFNYGFNEATDKGVEVLASSPTMIHLRSLGLAGNGLSGEAVRALARSTTLTSLQHLDLSHSLMRNPIGDSDLAVLLKSPLFARLSYLNLCGSAISDTGVRRLSRCPAAAGLRVLVLGGSYRIDDTWRNYRISLTAESVRALARSRFLGRLRRLELPLVPVDDKAAELLARSPGLEGLRELVVEANPILTEAGQAALQARFGDGLEIRSSD